MAKPKRARKMRATKGLWGGYSVAGKPARATGKSAKSKRKAARKRAAGPRIVQATLSELTGPLPRAYWGTEAASARKRGNVSRARGRLKAGRDPLESVLPKLPR